MRPAPGCISPPDLNMPACTATSVGRMTPGMTWPGFRRPSVRWNTSRTNRANGHCPLRSGFEDEAGRRSGEVLGVQGEDPLGRQGEHAVRCRVDHVGPVVGPILGVLGG